MASLPRYGPLARCYDVLSFERPVYRPGRVVGIEALWLRPGARVLDVGCGTGLNFPLLRDEVGEDGLVVGVDASAVMLGQARRRIQRHGWANVRTHQADAADLSAVLGDGERFDAVLFTYSLSIIDDWRAAWAQATARMGAGARVSVVDLALPAGAWRPLRPLARFACFTGGSDPHRAPWQAVPADTDEAGHVVLRGGHIRVSSGTRRASAQRPVRSVEV